MTTNTRYNETITSFNHIEFVIINSIAKLDINETLQRKS